MFDLLDDHFEGVVFERFQEDLAEKHWVLVIRDDEKVIQGFTTARLLDAEVDGDPVRAIYSGDTIINREYWGDKILGTLFLRFVVRTLKLSVEKRRSREEGALAGRLGDGSRRIDDPAELLEEYRRILAEGAQS